MINTATKGYEKQILTVKDIPAFPKDKIILFPSVIKSANSIHQTYFAFWLRPAYFPSQK